MKTPETDWDYMIAHYPRENERAIMRVNEDSVQWLTRNEEWTREQKRAKRFYHEADVKWALILARRKCLKEEELHRKVEKQSWGEL